ncbi:perilipin-2 [Procambarus clarkii]|uniref:perilipin-2 n=1 Tax=Procambarus clarkii TaxID=6728 RepID=UPI00374281B1
MFVNRVKSLPVMHDALSLASSLYHTTKDKQYVGVAVQVAAVAVGATASKALSLASPLVEQGGRWAALDELACKGLDCVKQAVPIITKPTKEIVSITRNVALSALAGVNTSVPPPTIGAALASRTTRMMWCVAESKGGRVALSTAGSLLDTAHIYLDTYLPPAKVDLYNSDGQDGPLGVKMVALSNKTRRRFKRCVHTRLNVNCNQDLDDDDDIIITSGHLLELGRRSLLNWHHHMSQLHYTLLVTGISK